MNEPLELCESVSGSSRGAAHRMRRSGHVSTGRRSGRISIDLVLQFWLESHRIRQAISWLSFEGQRVSRERPRHGLVWVVWCPRVTRRVLNLLNLSIWWPVETPSRCGHIGPSVGCERASCNLRRLIIAGITCKVDNRRPLASSLGLLLRKVLWYRSKSPS